MRGTEVSEFIDSVYTWQERAIKAEAEVERLQTELALLRKVADAGEIMWSDAICHRCESQVCRGCAAHDFKQAMSEYQSWKEGQSEI